MHCNSPNEALDVPHVALGAAVRPPPREVEHLSRQPCSGHEIPLHASIIKLEVAQVAGDNSVLSQHKLSSRREAPARNVGRDFAIGRVSNPYPCLVPDNTQAAG